jgi:hypothetical protein
LALLKERLTAAIEARHWTLLRLEALLEVVFTPCAVSLFPAASPGSDTNFRAKRSSDIPEAPPIASEGARDDTDGAAMELHGAEENALEDIAGMDGKPLCRTPVRVVGLGHGAYPAANLAAATANASEERVQQGGDGSAWIQEAGTSLEPDDQRKGQAPVRARLAQAGADARGLVEGHARQATAALVLRVRGHPALLLTLALSSGLLHLHAAPSQIHGYAVATVHSPPYFLCSRNIGVPLH